MNYGIFIFIVVRNMPDETASWPTENIKVHEVVLNKEI